MYCISDRTEWESRLILETILHIIYTATRSKVMTNDKKVCFALAYP